MQLKPDVICSSLIKDLDEDYRYMLNGYRQGILSEQRLDEAITRILATKAALGLYKKAKSEIVPTEEALRVMRSDETCHMGERKCQCCGYAG